MAHIRVLDFQAVLPMWRHQVLACPNILYLCHMTCYAHVAGGTAASELPSTAYFFFFYMQRDWLAGWLKHYDVSLSLSLSLRTSAA